MIYTLTLNPAVDYVMDIAGVIPGKVNRSSGESYTVGGKGINVSVVLSRLGARTKALGFVAGFTGDAIVSGLDALGVEHDLVRLENGFSRINVKIRTGKGEETELNGCGPHISREMTEELFRKLDAVKDGDTLVIAGSVPESLPDDIYEIILSRLDSKGVCFAVDACGELLLRSLRFRPYVIKPNIHELGALFSADIKSMEEVERYARALKENGAANVLVSMGADGAFLLDEYGKTHKCGVCKGKAVNAVGSGDSMLAGFLYAAESGDYAHALRLGTAAGGATAFSEGLAEREDIYRLLSQLEQTM